MLGRFFWERRSLYRYAQTNIQLYEQLIDAGYSDSDLICVRGGYDLAVRLFSG